MPELRACQDLCRFECAVDGDVEEALVSIHS